MTAKRSLTGDNTERVDTRVLKLVYDVAGTDQPLYVGQRLDVFLAAKPDAMSSSVAQSDRRP